MMNKPNNDDGRVCKTCKLGKQFIMQRCCYSSSTKQTKVLSTFVECDSCHQIDNFDPNEWDLKDDNNN